MNMKFTFKGGAHVREYKLTADKPVREMPAPAFLSIPLTQHIGAPAKPVLSPGDKVLRGQVIAAVEGALGCPIHSPISGTVKKLVPGFGAAGTPVSCMVIENDFRNTLDPSVKPYGKPLAETSADEIAELIRSAGIVGMGGATFPAYAKLRSAVGKVDRMIVNAAECEPFITADHRMMLEHPDWILGGAAILLHALGLEKGTVAIEDNKPDAIEKFRTLCENSPMGVATMKTKYPQGDERQLIYALTGRELPSGKLPADVGCVIFNAETCAAVHGAFYHGYPLMERIVTVSGDVVKEPSNLRVPVGATFRDLIEFCGGLTGTPKKMISGGPMMGFSQWDFGGSVTKGTSALLLLSEKFAGNSAETDACIHCGRCVAHCPMHLMPNYISAYSRQSRYEEAEALSVMSCVECGTCAYNCPAHIPLVSYMRNAKAAIRARDQARKAAASLKKEAKSEG